MKALVAQPGLDLNEAPVGNGLTALSLGVVSGGEDLVGEGRCQCVPGRHIWSIPTLAHCGERR